MSLLQYTSQEMFSSTELVRKNKNIFDKLNKKEIEKAVILRDGKPNIILLDFFEYEKIIADYLKLKEKSNLTNNEPKINVTVNKKIEKIDEDVKLSAEYKLALEQIEKLDFKFDSNKVKEKDDALKEFWE